MVSFFIERGNTNVWTLLLAIGGGEKGGEGGGESSPFWLCNWPKRCGSLPGEEEGGKEVLVVSFDGLACWGGEGLWYNEHPAESYG